MKKEKFEPFSEEKAKAIMAEQGLEERSQEVQEAFEEDEDRKRSDIIQESLNLLKKAKNSGKRVLIVAKRDNPNMPSRIEGLVKDFYDKYSNDRYRSPRVGVNESDLEEIKEKLEVRIYYHPDNPDYDEVVSLDEIQSIEILD